MILACMVSRKVCGGDICDRLGIDPHGLRAESQEEGLGCKQHLLPFCDPVLPVTDPLVPSHL